MGEHRVPHGDDGDESQQYNRVEQNDGVQERAALAAPSSRLFVPAPRSPGILDRHGLVSAHGEGIYWADRGAAAAN